LRFAVCNCSYWRLNAIRQNPVRFDNNDLIYFRASLRVPNEVEKRMVQQYVPVYIIILIIIIIIIIITTIIIIIIISIIELIVRLLQCGHEHTCIGS